MARADSTFIAIGGGKSEDSIRDAFFDAIEGIREASVAVMTVASNDVAGLSSDYNTMFRKRNVKHVSMIDIFKREDAISIRALKKVERADAIYFTGGDQLNITSLFGGSPYATTSAISSARKTWRSKNAIFVLSFISNRSAIISASSL